MGIQDAGSPLGLSTPLQQLAALACTLGLSPLVCIQCLEGAQQASARSTDEDCADLPCRTVLQEPNGTNFSVQSSFPRGCTLAVA